jgi:anti-sigma regulatory factor (Ser/Thr protein kinase)
MEALLPPEPASLARARSLVGRVTNAPRAVVENAKLILTELLANEIKHGRYERGDTLCCRVNRRESDLRIEVRHPGPPFDMPRAPITPSLEMRETGWGMALITRLADRWGLDESEGKRQVWAEIDLGPKPLPRSA